MVNEDQVVHLSMRDVGIDGFTMGSAYGRDQVVGTARHSGWWSFEQPLPAVVLRICQLRTGRFVDIGANTGFYSLLALSAPISVYHLLNLILRFGSI